MHEGQLEPTETEVASMLARRFPEHAGAAVRRVRSSGTVVAPFRVGEHLLARVPLVPDASEVARERLTREQQHATDLGSSLGVEVPRPVGVAGPEVEYPGVWSLWSWLEGTSLDRSPPVDHDRLARDLAALVRRFHDRPTEGRSWNGEGRGGLPLADTAWVRESILRSAHLVDAAPVTALWERALAAPAQVGPAVVIHGDPMPGNLLVRDGVLTGLVDISVPSVGDPAADLQPAWVIFEEPHRSTFLAAVGLDDAARERGRGWALEMAIGGLHYYEHTNPTFSRMAARTIDRLLDSG